MTLKNFVYDVHFEWFGSLGCAIWCLAFHFLFSYEWTIGGFAWLMRQLMIALHSFEVAADDLFNQRRFIRKSANIGGSKILECEISYSPSSAASSASFSSSSSSSAVRPSEQIVTWRKKGREAPIFSQFNGYPPHIDDFYQGRIRMLPHAAVEIKDIRNTDEGWYDCTVVRADGTEESTANGTSVYLAVNCELIPFNLVSKARPT